MPIGMNALTSGNTNATAQAYDTASVTPTANALVLIAFTALDNGQLPTGVTGNGLTWVSVKSLRIPSPTSGDHSISVFRAMGASPSAGVITMSFNANQIRCRWSVVEFTGVDTSGTNGSGAIVQAESSLSSGATTLTVTLAAFGSANNAAYGAFVHRAAEGTAFGTGFTEIHDVGAGGANMPTVQTEWQLADDDPDASWATSSACGAVGIEINAAAAGTTVTPGVLAMTISTFITPIGFGFIPGVNALITTRYAPPIGLGVVPANATLTTTAYAPPIGTGVVPSVLALVTSLFTPVVSGAAAVAGVIPAFGRAKMTRIIGLGKFKR